MRWPWQQPESVQQNTEELLRTLERRIATLEWAEKKLQQEADEWIQKYRTLYARTCKAAERMERHAPAQDAPGTTIEQSGGETPQPDRWMALAARQRARRGA